MTMCELMFYETKAYMDGTGTGYLQEKFSITCTKSQCLLRIDKGALGMRKFMDDIVWTGESPRYHLA